MRNEKLTIFIGAEKLRLVKRYKTSILEFRRILEFDPEDAGVKEKIGDVLVEWNKDSEALIEYKDAVAFFLKQAERENALNCLKKITTVDPENEFNYKNDALEKIEAVSKEIEEVKQQTMLEEEVEKQRAQQEELQKEIVSLGSPLFDGCSLDELSEVVKATNILEITKGDVLFKQGDPGESLYIIDAGVMEVMVSKKPLNLPKDQPEAPYIPEDTDKSIIQLERGDFFGEISFLAGSNRSATLIAKEDSRLFEISRDDFRKVLKVFPMMEERLLRYYKIRVLDLILAKSALFSFLDTEQRETIRKYFVLAKYNKGEVIIEEGSEGRDLYLIKYGVVQVVTSDPSGDQMVLTKLHAHSFFGEVSFLTGKQRTANVIAATPVELLVFSNKNLMTIIKEYPRIKEILQNFQKKRAFQTIKKFKKV